MCLAAFAIGHGPRRPLVVVANRDEYFDRAAAPLAWWRPPGRAAEVLGGRDLSAGGAWLGLNAAGRLALLTNVREPGRHDPTAPSRGAIVLDWLHAAEPTAAYFARLSAAGHNGFNLVAIDVAQGEAWWFSNRAAAPVALGPGLYGLSNAALDTPWPKLVRLKQRLAQALAGDALAPPLWAALSDRQPAPDAELPATGVPPERERQLSPAFIRIAPPDGRVYGTRCSTLVVTDGTGLRMSERRYGEDGAIAGESQVQLARWPS